MKIFDINYWIKGWMLTIPIYQNFNDVLTANAVLLKDIILPLQIRRNSTEICIHEAGHSIIALKSNFQTFEKLEIGGVSSNRYGHILSNDNFSKLFFKNEKVNEIKMILERIRVWSAGKMGEVIKKINIPTWNHENKPNWNNDDLTMMKVQYEILEPVWNLS